MSINLEPTSVSTIQASFCWNAQKLSMGTKTQSLLSAPQDKAT